MTLSYLASSLVFLTLTALEMTNNQDLLGCCMVLFLANDLILGRLLSQRNLDSKDVIALLGKSQHQNENTLYFYEVVYSKQFLS